MVNLGSLQDIESLSLWFVFWVNLRIELEATYEFVCRSMAEWSDEEREDIAGDELPTFAVDHPYLKFTHQSLTRKQTEDFSARMEIAVTRQIQRVEVVDWDVLNSIKPDDVKIDEMLLMVYMRPNSQELLFASEAWSRLFRVRESIYIEATYEFYSLFLFEDFQTDVRAKSVHFVPCGALRYMSLVKFALALGLYTYEETTSAYFDDHLKNGLKKPSFSESLGLCGASLPIHHT